MVNGQLRATMNHIHSGCDFRIDFVALPVRRGGYPKIARLSSCCSLATNSVSEGAAAGRRFLTWWRAAAMHKRILRAIRQAASRTDRNGTWEAPHSRQIIRLIPNPIQTLLNRNGSWQAAYPFRLRPRSFASEMEVESGPSS